MAAWRSKANIKELEQRASRTTVGFTHEAVGFTYEAVGFTQ